MALTIYELRQKLELLKSLGRVRVSMFLQEQKLPTLESLLKKEAQENKGDLQNVINYISYQMEAAKKEKEEIHKGILSTMKQYVDKVDEDPDVPLSGNEDSFDDKDFFKKLILASILAYTYDYDKPLEEISSHIYTTDKYILVRTESVLARLKVKKAIPPMYAHRIMRMSNLIYNQFHLTSNYENYNSEDVILTIQNCIENLKCINGYIDIPDVSYLSNYKLGSSTPEMPTFKLIKNKYTFNGQDIYKVEKALEGSPIIIGLPSEKSKSKWITLETTDIEIHILSTF